MQSITKIPILKSLLSLLLCIFVYNNCITTKAIIQNRKNNDNFGIDTTLMWSICHAYSFTNPKVVISLFQQTMTIDSIIPYFTYNDFASFVKNDSLLSSFVDANISTIMWPKEFIQPFALVEQKVFTNSELVKNTAKLQIDFKTMDTLDNVFMLSSRPAYTPNRDTALICIDFYTSKWDFGEIYLLKKETSSWIIKKQMYLWAHKKEKRRNLGLQSKTTREAFYDTSLTANIKNVFASVSIINVEEDTILIRPTMEVIQQIEPAINKVETDYKKLFKPPRPKGIIYLQYHINCAGDVYDIGIHKDDIGIYKDDAVNRMLDSIVVANLYNVKYKDNLRTNRCGKVEVTCTIEFKD